MAHLRAKFDSTKKDAVPDGFEKLYELLQTPTPTPTLRRTRRGERIGARPNPFVNFREKHETQIDDDDDGSPTVVSKYFDGHRACALRDDGTIELADTYTTTDTGFVRAQWLLEGIYLDLEVPNNCCRDGCLVLEAPDPPVMKRPAMAKVPVPEANHDSGTEAEEEEEEQVAEQKVELGEDEAKDEAPKKRRVAEPNAACFKLVPGHGTKMTIAARSTAGDKAQILEVTSATCEGTGYTPTTACLAIIEEMQDEAMELLTVPVARHPALRQLRLRARALRRKLLRQLTS